MKRIPCLVLSLTLFSTLANAATIIFTGSNSPSVDDTVALQTAVNSMSSGDTLVIQGASRISTVVLGYRSGLTLQIDGVVSSIFIDAPSTGGYSSAPSKNPLFDIYGGNNLKITSTPGGYLRNGYGEAVAAQGVNGLELSSNISGAGIGSWDAIYLNGNSNVVVQNCYIRKSSAISYTARADLGSTGNGHGLKAFENLHLLISNVNVSEVRGNGIYIGSGNDPSVVDSSTNHYQNTIVRGNRLTNNGYSGIQVAWSGTNAPKDITITDNDIWNNLADGIDLNMGSTPYNMWAQVTGNRLFNNGFVNGAGSSANDGSGIATVISGNKVTLAGNVAIAMNATGMYVANSSDVTYSGNVVIKNSNTIGQAADAECGATICSNVSFTGNDLYVTGSSTSMNNLRTYTKSASSVTWATNYVLGGNIEWVLSDDNSYYHQAANPGTAVPAPSGGLSISNTNFSLPSHYRWLVDANSSSISSSDYIIAYTQNGGSPRIRLVGWSTNATPHVVYINVTASGMTPSNPYGQVNQRLVDGSPAVPSPSLSNNVLALVLGSSPIYVDVP